VEKAPANQQGFPRRPPRVSATCQLRHHGFLGRDKPQFLGDISPRCRKLLVAYLQIHRKGSRLERLLRMVFERSSFRSVAVRVFLRQVLQNQASIIGASEEGAVNPLRRGSVDAYSPKGERRAEDHAAGERHRS